jgi:hypothetical protein
MEKEKKVCFKCGKELFITEFYVHKQMLDGHLNKCKECTKRDSAIRERSLRNDPIWVENEKKRAREKYYRLEYKGKHYPSSDKKKEIIKKHNQKYPEKALSRKYTEIFLTKKEGYNLHHWSYNQEDWLDIIELSVKEHAFLHRFIKYDQERMMYRDLSGILLDTKERHLKYFEECKIKYSNELNGS